MRRRYHGRTFCRKFSWLAENFFREDSGTDIAFPRISIVLIIPYKANAILFPRCVNQARRIVQVGTPPQRPYTHVSPRNND